eukprot:13983-Heterococcus_DN1.PRE.2
MPKSEMHPLSICMFTFDLLRNLPNCKQRRNNTETSQVPSSSPSHQREQDASVARRLSRTELCILMQTSV